MLRLVSLVLLINAAPVQQVDQTPPAILWALRLPALVTEARQVGVDETLVKGVLDGLRGQGLTADEAAMVMSEEVDAVNAGEPKDNFGGFVHQQLDAGLRGRALAQAIQAEHQARGIGRRGGHGPAKEGKGKRGGDKS